jgi:hypothetical protein
MAVFKLPEFRKHSKIRVASAELIKSCQEDSILARVGRAEQSGRRP